MLNDDDLVFIVELGNPHLDLFVSRSGYVLSDVVSAYRKLVVATVHHYGKLNLLWPAEIHERVERRACRSSGVKYVVYQHDYPVNDADWQRRWPHQWLWAACQIIAIEIDIESPHRYVDVLEILDCRCYTVSDWDSAPLEADQHQVAGTLVAFDNLVRDSANHTPHIVRIHQLALVGQKNLSIDG